MNQYKQAQNDAWEKLKAMRCPVCHGAGGIIINFGYQETCTQCDGTGMKPPPAPFGALTQKEK